MTPINPEKAKPGSVSLYPRQWAHLKAKKEGASGFLQEMVQGDMAGQGSSLPDASVEDCLVALCEAFAPTYAKEMRERVEGVDQPKALEMLLKQYATGMLGLSDEFLRSSYPLAAEDGPGYKGSGGKPPPRE